MTGCDPRPWPQRTSTTGAGGSPTQRPGGVNRHAKLLFDLGQRKNTAYFRFPADIAFNHESMLAPAFAQTRNDVPDPRVLNFPDGDGFQAIQRRHDIGH